MHREEEADFISFFYQSFFFFFSQRGPWLQPVQMTRCICGICVRGGPPSCIPSNSTERGRHYLLKTHTRMSHAHTHAVYSKGRGKPLVSGNIKQRQREPNVSELESLFAVFFYLGLKKRAAELSGGNFSNARNEITWHAAYFHAKAFMWLIEAFLLKYAGFFLHFLQNVCLSKRLTIKPEWFVVVQLVWVISPLIHVFSLILFHYLMIPSS